MALLEDMAIGFLSGLTVSITGAIKDAPYEGFDFLKFIRSPIIGAVESPLIVRSMGKPVDAPLLYLSTIATERITVEVYKLIRAKQGLYIPSKFKVGEWGLRKSGIR